jgi:hypothetical protein
MKYHIEDGGRIGEAGSNLGLLNGQTTKRDSIALMKVVCPKQCRG